MPRIPSSVIEAMVSHAHQDLPNEACGMVHARDGVAFEAIRVKNDAASPFRYEMNPLQMLKLDRRREDEGESLFAIYHSHVASEAYPSPTDVRMAFWPPGEIDNEPMFPETYYVLVSLKYDPPAVRAFHIRMGGVIEEEPIEVVD
ncbi:MAG: M67 family metallopeptidase [Dehalococcoidia bacterium]|nr:M67 family metallopeptidase [Dehalococcoidia bacterium]